MPYRVTKDRVQEVFAQVAQAANYDVLVGIPQENATRGDDGVSNVELAYIHEYGSPARNIPARPHFIPAIQASADGIRALSQEGIAGALRGNKSAVRASLERIGAYCVGQIQHKIATGPFTPLAEQTIRRKGSSRPLIDTGAYRQSISYVVRRRNAE